MDEGLGKPGMSPTLSREILSLQAIPMTEGFVDGAP